MKPPDSSVGQLERVTARLSNGPEVVIEPANPRRTPIEELQGLARGISRGSSRIPVRFAYHEPEEGKYGVTWVEVIHIWLPRMADAIEAAIVIEVAKKAISWARKRMRASKAPRQIYIYAEDGRVLREIQVKDRKGDPEVRVPGIEERTRRTKAPLRERACGNCRYALILTKRFLKVLKTAIVTVIRSPQIVTSAIRTRRLSRTARCTVRLYEEECRAVEIQRILRRLVIEKIRRFYEETGLKLKENATFGSANETVQFDTVFEHEDGRPRQLVHIHYARHGSKREETRRYAEALAQFHEKLKDYRRLTSRGAMAIVVFVVPHTETMGNPLVDWGLFPGAQDFASGSWLFSYKDLGFDEHQVNQETSQDS